MQSSIEKKGIQLIMMNKDLNGIAVLDKNKFKRQPNSKDQFQPVTEYGSFFRRNSSHLTTRSGLRNVAQEDARSFAQWA
jgi:hypothetical protein